MRIFFIIILFISFNLKAENTPTVVLTAGTEFSPVQLMDGESITQGNIEYRSDCNFNPYNNESKLTSQSSVYTVKTSGSRSKDKTILLAGLLIAIALYYITKKSSAKKAGEQTPELAKVNFEEEEKQELKKEVWNLMSTPGVIETETIRENIIAIKPVTYTKQNYTCSQGQLTIEQAYQHPNIGESVWLNDLPAPSGKYKIGLLISVEVVDSKIFKVLP